MCHALGHTDTSMTKQYTNLDKVELKRAFPDIVAMKDSNSDGKNLPRGYRVVLKLWIYACYMIDYRQQMNKFAGVV